MNDIENENEDNDMDQYNCEPDKEKEQEEKEEVINENIEKVQINPDENWSKIIQKILEEINENSDELLTQLIKFCKELKFNENLEGPQLIKTIITEAYKCSNINFSQRLISFIEFILSEKNLNFENIYNTIKNNNEEKVSKNTDIINLWKEFLTEDYLFSKLTINQKELAKEKMKLLLQENYYISEIYNIFQDFNLIFNIENFSQIEIINSLFSIIMAYEIKEFDEDYKHILNKNYNEENSELNPKVVLEFYLKISEKAYAPKALTINELLQRLKNLNPNLPDMIIKRREEQFKIVEATKEKYKKYEKEDFQKWAEKDYQKLDFNEENFDESTAKVIGMISLVIKKEKDYYLRDAQILAILMFIGKDKKYGLIEEISTGEGKSCIICSLAIYFALKKKKVDIISSSMLLAQRDSDEFKKIYDYFNLTTSYTIDYNPKPYKADILYGTFLEFEGDCLREKISDAKIRNKRKFEVIIIDEVDNLLIDNILSNTSLTGSTKGFKFLIPLYLSTYLSFELYDFLFLYFFVTSLKSIDPTKRQKYEKLIKDPEYRKKVIVNVTKSLFQNVKKENENVIKDELIDEINKLQPEQLNEEEMLNMNKEMIKEVNTIYENTGEFFKNLAKYLEYPEFLSSFVNLQMPYWTNSAFEAKNLMTFEIDYVITKSNNDIAPVDRTNTGETEISTVYSNGLHQMLEIKHKLRIKDETLTDTFLSHVSYFQEFRKDEEFLFFGLTGTVGDLETQKIYQQKFFNSKLLFIPQYKKKRFIELPPKLSQVGEHDKDICEDIIINFYKGRRILVICDSIKEAKIIKNKLETYNIEHLKMQYPDINYNYKDQILLYTRSDNEEKENLKKKEKIILSTNIGGRGTDIKTTEEEEKNGGLHVILTNMPSNYRVLKQAFGRTSREGKKGTGQIIINNLGYNNYSELMDKINKDELRRIKDTQRHLKILLFKDRLFKEFCEIIKILEPNSLLFADIRERWAIFLNDKVTKFQGDEFKEDTIKKEFDDFKKEIKELLDKDKDYERFNNPFLKIEAGLRKYRNYEKELNHYLDINIKTKRFFFTIPYLKAIILIKNQQKYDEEFFKTCLFHLNQTKLYILNLKINSIEPVLNSFSQWEKLFENLQIKINQNEKIIENIDNKDFSKSDLYIQYKNIGYILSQIIKKINENIIFIEEYKVKYGDNDKYYIYPIEEELIEGLNLDSVAEKELQFFYDASFHKVFSLKRRNKYPSFRVAGFLFKFFCSLLFIPPLIVAVGVGLIGGIMFGIQYAGRTLLSKIGIVRRNTEIENNSIFANILSYMLHAFRSENEDNNNIELKAEHYDENQNNQSFKKELMSKIIENVENKFNHIIKLNIVRFLLFVDSYLSNHIWNNKIFDIIDENFKNIYVTKFYENLVLFKGKITKENFDDILSKYNLIFQEFWKKCLKDINNLKNKKDYNESTGINSLEHLIRRINPDKITEEIIDQTFKQILKSKIFDDNGYANKKLFKDCFTQVINKEEKNLTQEFPINITNKIEKNEIKEISKLKKFGIQGFKIPIIDGSFRDLIRFYQKHNYNAKEQLEKDYTLLIINNIKDILTKLLLTNNKIYKLFFKRLLNQIKTLIRNLLEEKVFTKNNIKNVEKEIALSLNEDEKKEFFNLIKKAEENIKQFNNKEL